MTFKSDGKSTTSKEEILNEKFTQRPSDDDYSEEEARQSAEVSEKQRKGFLTYFLLGFGAILFFALMMNDNKWENNLNDQFRDETLAKQKLKKKESSPFSEA